MVRSSVCNGKPLGHNHPEVLQSIQSVITSGLPLHTLDLTTPLKDEFSSYLLSLLPGQGKEYCLQFTGPSGADAVEAALKLAKKVTGRSSIISFSGGYHGMTHGALSVTGNLSPKEAVSNMMAEVQFMPYPHQYRCPLGIGGDAGVKALTYYFENLINDVESGVRKPAAVILEAVQGEGGVNPAPVEWLQRIRKVTQEHGILLIIDEVQAGFARTGIYVICLLLICLWFAGMVLVGGYARQLWALWIVKAEVTVVDAETPAFKQSTQHYFFKKQPLPVVESVEEEDDPGVAVENATSSSEDEENTVEESDEKAGLRERVKNALNELER